MCRVNVSTAGVLFMDEFGLSQVAMGRIFSSFLLGYALCQIPAGLLSDRWGARRVLAIATWLWVAITALQTLVGWGPFQTTISMALGSFMLFRFVLGMTASPAYPASAVAVAKWVPSVFQGRANGIILASVGLGSALTPPIVTYVMVEWGWRLALIASSLPALILAIVWLRVPEQPSASINETVESEYTLSVPGRLRSPEFVLLTVSYTLQGYVGYIFVSWFYLYLVQERHFSLLTGAWMGSMPWVLSIISIPLGGLLSDRFASSLGPTWGRRVVPMVGMGFSGILISVGAHTENALTAAIALAFATALVLCVEGPFWTMMIQIARSRSGAAGGIMNMGSNAGGLLSPVLTPLIAAYIGWENALHIAAGLAIVAAVLWLGIRSHEPDNPQLKI